MTAALHHPRYRLGRLIATGGMGEVWAATDTLLEREVAVKLLKREYAEDATFRSRFAGEARSAGALQHPNVASVLDYGEITEGQDPPVPFLVMELVDGRPLSALLAGGTPLDPEVAAGLMAQAAEGVAAAHALGVVHRDVKPGNLLVTEDGRVKVTDFGVARAADTVPLTATGHIVGTPHYLPPEQAQGSSSTPASDVYSLGIVLYECLAGRKPFIGDSPVATALMQIRDSLPPFPASVPRRLQSIVRVATEKDPAARYPTAASFAAALRDESPDTRTFLMPQDAVAGVATPPAAEPATGPVAPAAGGEPGPAPRRTPGWLLVAVAGLLVLLGAGWAVLAADTGSTTPDPQPAEAPAGGEDLVRVRAAAYLGEPATAVARKLRRLGLTVQTSPRENPGARLAGTVASVTPAGMVERGSRIVLGVWGAPLVVDPASPGSADGSGSTGPSNGDSRGSETGGARGEGGGDSRTDGGGPGGEAGDGEAGGNSGGGSGNGEGDGQGRSSGSGKGGGKGSGSGDNGKRGKGGKR